MAYSRPPTSETTESNYRYCVADRLLSFTAKGRTNIDEFCPATIPPRHHFTMYRNATYSRLP
jgi:hypothetical protein